MQYKLPAVRPRNYNHAPTMTVGLVPQGSTTVPKGSTLTIELTVKNETSTVQAVDFWVSGIIAGPGIETKIPSSALNFPNPSQGWIPAGMTFTGTLLLHVPAYAPAGLFTLVASTGNFASGTYLDRAALSVRIVP